MRVGQVMDRIIMKALLSKTQNDNTAYITYNCWSSWSRLTSNSTASFQNIVSLTHTRHSENYAACFKSNKVNILYVINFQRNPTQSMSFYTKSLGWCTSFLHQYWHHCCVLYGHTVHENHVTRLTYSTISSEVFQRYVYTNKPLVILLSQTSHYLCYYWFEVSALEIKARLQNRFARQHFRTTKHPFCMDGQWCLLNNETVFLPLSENSENWLWPLRRRPWTCLNLYDKHLLSRPSVDCESSFSAVFTVVSRNLSKLSNESIWNF